VLKLLVLGEQVLVLVGVVLVGQPLSHLGHPGFESLQLVERGRHLDQQRVGRIKLRFLWQVGDPQVAVPGDRSDGRLQLPENQPEQGRFARAVRPDKPHLLTAMDRPVQAVEENLLLVTEMNILKRHNRHVAMICDRTRQSQ